jgi:Mn2+/Fe2+ NRAMP family transporter
VDALIKAALGIVTSVGGYLEVGSLSTALQAGAEFRFRLLWPIAIGTICISFLTEMAGRLAAVSKHTVVGAVRERFGAHYQIFPLGAQLLVDYLVLTSEIGGMALALQIVTGIGFQWWALACAVFVWGFLWRGSFGLIENGVAVLGLITLCFVVAAFRLNTPWSEAARGLLPRRPDHDAARYWFTAVSMLGATISPYLVSFYSSGAVEDEWKETHVPINRIVAGMGMGFGSLVAMSVVVVAGIVLHSQGIEVQHLPDAASTLDPAFGRWGRWLFAGSFLIGCFGAALELSLDASYLVAQSLGWNWGENLKPAEDARFCMVYTILLVAATLPIAIGVDPLALTMYAMALTVVALPIVIFPLIVLMNDRAYLRQYTNGFIGNAAVVSIVILSFVLAIVAIPLQIAGGQ